MGIRFRIVGGSDDLIEKNIFNKTIDTKSIETKGLSLIKDKTPVRSGVTRDSWKATSQRTRKGVDIFLENENTTKNGLPVVALIVSGHGTKQGTYIPPNDFVSPVLDEMEKQLDKEIERILNGI